MYVIIILSYVMLYYIILYVITLHYVMLRYIILLYYVYICIDIMYHIRLSPSLADALLLSPAFPFRSFPTPARCLLLTISFILIIIIITIIIISYSCLLLDCFFSLAGVI